MSGPIMSMEKSDLKKLIDAMDEEFFTFARSSDNTYVLCIRATSQQMYAFDAVSGYPPIRPVQQPKQPAEVSYRTPAERY